MKSSIYFDARWVGDHGIGRMARVIDDHFGFPHLPVEGSPVFPLDPVRMLLGINLRTPIGSRTFSPGFNAPLFVTKPYVFTICDLNHVDHAENTSFLRKLYYSFVVRRAVHKAFRILTISEYSRQRILEWSNVDPAKIVNVSCGVGANFHPGVQPYQPGYPYLLCVSNRKPHKNERRLLEAFARSGVAQDTRLVFTGAPTEALMDDARQWGVDSAVVFLGRVSEESLPGLYRGAVAMLFPSLYEGFGLPVVEAMACGTPVLTSNVTSLPEVAGDAALFVDPLSVDQIAAGIRRLCTEPELAQQLRERGLRQASLFSWQSVLDRVGAVMREFERA